MTEFKPLVFSGVQPTGNLHLGNYLGAITRFVALQAEHDCLYCVVDLHAITVFQNPDELKRNTREVTAAFIASGIAPNRAKALALIVEASFEGLLIICRAERNIEPMLTAARELETLVDAALPKGRK